MRDLVRQYADTLSLVSGAALLPRGHFTSPYGFRRALFSIRAAQRRALGGMALPSATYAYLHRPCTVDGWGSM
jgi:hypothetical protein